jgi:uncharacterized membrane protein
MAGPEEGGRQAAGGRDRTGEGRGEDHQPGLGGSKDSDEILNVRREVTAHRTRAAAWIDATGQLLSRPAFLLALVVLHLGWIVLNLGVVAVIEPWDPYPFMLLATIASVEAPLLAVVILTHQRRETRVDEVRGELELQVALQVERETTAILRLVADLHRKLDAGVPRDADRIERLEGELDPHHLLQSVKRHLEEVEGGGPDKP